MRQLKHFLMAGAVVAVSATAWSQQPPRSTEAATPPAEAETNELVLKTQFLEAHKAKKWAEARDAFVKLRRQSAGVLQDKRLMYLYAEAQHNLGDAPSVAGAATTLEGLLELQDNHVRGLFLLAKIKAASKSAQDKERAKDLLIQAARAGLYVLRDISSADGKKTFGFLLSDPAFILRVMNAANEYQVTAAAKDLHNPFVSPLVPSGKDDGSGVEPPVVINELDPRQAELEERIENLFKDIVKLAEERQVEELITKFTELRQIMNEYEGIGTAEVRKKLEKWSQRLSDLGEVQLSIKLQVFISEGNQHLRAMAEAIRAEQYDAALDHFTQIEVLCEQMRGEEREVFHRNAEALFLRGKALADRARRLKRISEFRLTVTGVVVAPPDGKEPDSAIINDRIYREGDTVMDDTDEEIEGLRVVEIIRSTVRFRFEDTEFVRELKPQQ